MTYGVVEYQFLQIGHVHLEREAGASLGFCVIDTDTEVVVHIVDALVENQAVVGHVHVTVVVDPFFVHVHQRTNDR